MCFTHQRSCVGRVLGLGGCSDPWGSISGGKHPFLLLMCQGSPLGQPNHKVEQGAHLGYSCRSVFRVQSRVEDGYRVANRRNTKDIFYHSILPFSLLFTFFSYIYLSNIYYLWVIGLRAEDLKTEWEFYYSCESEVTQSCPTLCDPMDCSLPGSSIHGILQARILEWVAISFSRRSSRPRDWTHRSPAF